MLWVSKRKVVIPMKRIGTAILGFTIVLSLSACQAVPQAPEAQGDAERLIENAQKEDVNSAGGGTGQSLAEQYGIPGTYTYEAQGADGKLNIHVDAVVTVPKGNAMPIYRVKAGEFSQETVDVFFQELCGDTEMWVYSGQRTKQQINDQIDNIHNRITQIQDDPNSADEVARANEALEILDEMLKSAPDNIVEDRSYGQLGELTKESGESFPGLEAYERYEGGSHGSGRTFLVKNDDFPVLWYNDYRNPAAGINFGFSASLPITEDGDVDMDVLSEIGLKPSEAKQMVQHLLDRTGSNMMVDSIYLQDDEQKGYVDGIVRPAERHAYHIYCVRTVDGLPCASIAGGSWPVSGDLTGKDWSYEGLDMIINGDGILTMMWRSPLEVTGKVNENATLKPFPEIQEVFEKMMSVNYEPEAELYSGMDFEINRVTLSLQRVSEEDSGDTGLLIPAWNFYGKLTVGSSEEQFEKLGESFMSINAIDGTVIDPMKGY